MMGPSHSLSASSAWLTMSAFGVPIVGTGFAQAGTMGGVAVLPVVALGTAVCAGAAIANDADSESSTFVNSFGIFGKGIHEVVNAVSLLVYNVTKTKYDSPKTHGHRTMTHTLPFALIAGAITSGLSILPGSFDILGKTFATGQFFSLLIMGIFLHLALAGLFEKQIKKARKKYGPYVLMAVSGVLTVITASFLPENDTYGWLGAAVAMGLLIHCLGDMVTKMGVPLVTPIKIRGKRWYDVRIPAFMAFRAGGGFEKAFLLPLFTIITLLAAAYHIPGARFITEKVIEFLPFVG